MNVKGILGLIMLGILIVSTIGFNIWKSKQKRSRTKIV